jgi:hypothetical protein
MRTRFALSFAFLLLATTWLALTDPAREQTVVASPVPPSTPRREHQPPHRAAAVARGLTLPGRGAGLRRDTNNVT